MGRKTTGGPKEIVMGRLSRRSVIELCRIKTGVLMFLNRNEDTLRTKKI